MSVTETINKSVLSTGGASPLGAAYYQVGSNEQSIDTILAIGTNQPQAASFGPAGTSSGDLLAIELLASANMTIATNGTGSADVQTISISGTPTGGTFALEYGGKITAPVAYNASAATVQAALQALGSIGSGNITCTGGPLPGTAVACTFAGALATGLKSLMNAGGGGLTGGTSPTVSVAHTTPGLPQDTIGLAAGIPLQWDSASGLACPFAGAVSQFYVTNASAGRLQGRILTA